MPESALVLANGLLDTPFAKTTHGLVRGPSRFPLAGVVDAAHAGRDAGEVLDGEARGIPIFPSVRAMIETTGTRPEVCVVGVATVGGVLPPEVHAGLVEAAEAGMSLVNGLHRLLADDPELARLTRRHGKSIVDLRKPRPTSELRFWTGEVYDVPAPRVAVIGTDCALGKRTTASQLRKACGDAGIRAEMIYTGQTGWLQGFAHGFILDATPNDFVCGELEGAILDCWRETGPDLILIEGQAALRNPSGPCGSELLVSGAAAGAILQHAPARRYFTDYEELGCEIPSLAEEIQLVRLFGSEVWAVTLNDEGLDPQELEATRARMEAELGVPVVHPLKGGMPKLVEIVRGHLDNDPAKTP